MNEIVEKRQKNKRPRRDSWIKLIKLFVKAQISAFIGVIFDYALMILLTEVYGLYYVYSIACGAAFGSIINYVINRYWAFKARKESAKTQFAKFVVVVISSIILKILGTYLLTEFTQLDYKIARILVDACVAYGYIFVLQKFWVFKE